MAVDAGDHRRQRQRALIALHQRHGFRMVGALRSVGYKLGRWVDTPIMQRTLGPGDSQPPDDLTAPPAR